jgi:4-amino-4-deoxy-L-arabinose transferase-like glycosyltransferase
MLAGVYALFGVTARRFFWARFVQAVIGAFLAPLTYLLAEKLLGKGDDPESDKKRQRVARIAACVVAFYPMLLLYPLALATENLFFPLVLLSLLVTLIAAEKGSLKWFLLAGVLFGLTALTRSVVSLAGVAAAGWAWFMAKQRKGALLLGLAMLATVTPWVIRNSLLYGHFTWIETSMGYNLYIGYHPKSTGTFTVDASFDLLKILDDDERNQVGVAQTKQFILADPLRVVPLTINRLGYFFGLERRALTYFYSNGFFGYIPLPLLLLIAGVVMLPFVGTSLSACFGLARPWNRADWLLILFLLAYLLPNVLIMAEERFHMALVPLLAVYAAQAWTGWKTLASGWRTRTGRIFLILAICAALLLCLNWGLELYRDADKLALLLGPNGHQSGFSY